MSAVVPGAQVSWVLDSKGADGVMVAEVSVGRLFWMVTDEVAAAVAFFSVTMQGDLLSGEQLVRPVLMSAGKQVGAAGMAIDAELDRATGCVKLQPGKPITVAFLLSDESAVSLRVVVQDPATDADLYRSPTDIPVRLGV
jgi:hypothetical protein